MTSIRLISALLGMTLLGSCDLVELVGSLPVITPDPLDFRSNSPTKTLTARITRNGARMAATGLAVTCEVSLRLTPNRATTPMAITAVQREGTRWTCTLPLAIRTNQVLQWQWRVSSGTTPLADSGRRDEMPDCPNPTRALIDLRSAAIGRFPAEMNHDDIINGLEYVPVHGFTSYKGTGVAFVRARPPVNNLVVAATDAMRNFGAPRPEMPDILLFRPAGNRVTDADGPDNPYRLIGWGYAETIRPSSAQPRGSTGAPANNSRPAQRRPRLHCVPHHEWFIHSSGFHYSDGTFWPRSEPEPDRDDAGGHPSSASFLPALWYVLFFVNVGEAPTIGMVKSREPALPGITAPPNSFYYPTAYD